MQRDGVSPTTSRGPPDCLPPNSALYSRRVRANVSPPRELPLYPRVPQERSKHPTKSREIVRLGVARSSHHRPAPPQPAREQTFAARSTKDRRRESCRRRIRPKIGLHKRQSRTDSQRREGRAAAPERPRAKGPPALQPTRRR